MTNKNVESLNPEGFDEVNELHSALDQYSDTLKMIQSLVHAKQEGQHNMELDTFLTTIDALIDRVRELNGDE